MPTTPVGLPAGRFPQPANAGSCPKPQGCDGWPGESLPAEAGRRNEVGPIRLREAEVLQCGRPPGPDHSTVRTLPILVRPHGRRGGRSRCRRIPARNHAGSDSASIVRHQRGRGRDAMEPGRAERPRAASMRRGPRRGGSVGRSAGALLLIVCGVLLDERRPLGRQVFLGEDGRHRALVDAEAAVDAGWPSPGTRRRRGRSRCRCRGRCRASRPPRSPARPSSGGCSRPGRPRRRRYPSFRCRVAR